MVILRSSYVCWDMNIVPFAFFERFFESCSMDVNQCSKYCKKKFRSHENYKNDRSDQIDENLSNQKF